jgi:hypothetical protein
MTNLSPIFLSSRSQHDAACASRLNHQKIQPGSRLRILWISSAVSNGSGGDAILDRNFASILARHHDVETLALARGSMREELAGAALHLVPPERGRFATRKNFQAVHERLKKPFDAIVFSHEYLDLVARQIAKSLSRTDTAIALILHNVTSDLLREVFGGAPIGAVLEPIWRLHEQRVYREPLLDAFFVLSQRDRELVTAVSRRPDVFVVHPGAPPAIPLKSDADVVPELILSGTFDWKLKRRDVIRFADAYQATEVGKRPAMKVQPGFDPELAKRLGAIATSVCFEGAIRFGLITDRFVAGHKLKTSAYLMNNCIVLSYSDVRRDFAFAPFSDIFIRRVHSIDEIRAVMAEFSSMPIAVVRDSLDTCKRAIASRLSWQQQASALEHQLIAATMAKRRRNGRIDPAA